MKVEGTMEVLLLIVFMDEKGITDFAVGLSSLVNHIEDLVPQCRRSFRSDEHKTEYFVNTVAEFTSWSLIPIQSINTLNYTYKVYASALYESLQTHNLIKLMNENQAN